MKDCIRAIFDVFSFGIIAACLYAATLFQTSFFFGLGLPLLLFLLVLGSLLSLAWLFWFRNKSAAENLLLLKKLFRINRFTIVAIALIILGGLITSTRYSFQFEPVLRGTSVLRTPFYEDRWTGKKYWIPWFHLSESWVRFPEENWIKDRAGIWRPRHLSPSLPCPLNREMKRLGKELHCPTKN